MEKVDKDYQCGYCLSEVEDMISPRYLPCGHLFCLPCLESDYVNSPHIVCVTCRKKHCDVDTRSLPAYVIEVVALSKCDLCEEKVAEKFCAKCDKALCSVHAQEHEKLLEGIHKFDLTHKIVDINSLNQWDYLRQRNGDNMCSVHTKQEIKMACTQCYTALCVDCLSTSICSNGYTHKLIKVNELTDRLKTNLKALLKPLFEKSNKAIELEKGVLCLLEENQNECERMKSLVEDTTNEQIEAIKKKSLELKAEIDVYQRNCADIVERYLTDLVNVKDSLDSLRKTIHTLNHQRTPMRQLFAEFSKTKLTAEKEIDKCFANLSVPKQTVLPKEKNRELEISISSEPCDVLRQLTFSEPTSILHSLTGAESEEWAGRYYDPVSWESVVWTSHKTLICSRRSYPIQIRTVDLTHLRSLDSQYIHACPLGFGLILLKYEGPGYVIDLFSGKFEKLKMLVSFSNQKEGASNYSSGSTKLCSTDDKFAVADNHMKIIRIYSAEGENLVDLNFALFISSVSGMSFINNDALLMMGGENLSSLFKFYLKDIPVPAWKCDFQVLARCLAVDDAGYTYVSSANAIHLVSDRGKELKVMKSAEFNNVRSISILAEKMAVASYNNIKLFKICF